MLTISGIDKGKTKLTIPNLVVQEQLYTYLLNTYNDADLNFSSYEKSELSSQLAYDGNWQAYFDYIADCLKRYASQRDKQKGEFFVHGFTLAMTAQTASTALSPSKIHKRVTSIFSSVPCWTYILT